MDNSNSIVNANNNNNNEKGNRITSVWVQLFERVGTDDPVPASLAVDAITATPSTTTDAAGTRTERTLRARGNPFEIEPVPKNIGVLCDKVKKIRRNALKGVDAADLFVYKLENRASATDEINLPTSTKKLSVGDKVPLRTTSRTPLVVVAPPMTAITPTVSASAQAAEMEEAIAMAAALDQARRFVEFIMKDMEELPESHGMKVMRDVIML